MDHDSEKSLSTPSQFPKIFIKSIQICSNQQNQVGKFSSKTPEKKGCNQRENRLEISILDGITFSFHKIKVIKKIFKCLNT
jgi:hypothetical protein